MEKTSKKFFSKELYLFFLKTFSVETKTSRLSIILYVFLFTFANFMFGYTNINVSNDEPALVTGDSLFSLAPALLIFSFIFAIESFSFIHKKNQTDFIISLPYKKSCIYFTLVALAASGIFLFTVIPVGIPALAFHFFVRNLYVSPLQVIFVILGSFLTFLSAYGIGVICCIISGNIVSSVFYTISAYLIPRIIVNLSEQAIIQMNQSIVSFSPVLNFFTFENTPLFIFFSPLENNMQNLGSVSLVAFETVVAVIEVAILLVLAGVLFCRRKMELSEKHITYETAHGVFRTLVSLPVLYVMIMDFELNSKAIICILLSFVTYFLFELITSRSIKETAKALPMFVVPIAVALCVHGANYGISKIYAMSNPVADEIESVSISDMNYSSFLRPKFETYYNLPTNSEKAANAIVSDLQRSISQSQGSNSDDYLVTVKIKLKSGKEISRKIRATKENFVTLLAEIISEEENTPHLALPAYDELSHLTVKLLDESGAEKYVDEISCDIYNVFTEEYNALSPYKKALSKVQKDDESSTLSFSTDHTSMVINPVDVFINDKDFPKTTALLRELFSQN